MPALHEGEAIALQRRIPSSRDPLELYAALTDHVLYWALGNTPFQREALYRQLTERSLTASQLALPRPGTSSLAIRWIRALRRASLRRTRTV